MFQLLRSRPAFRRLWLGGLVSQAGDWLSYVAVSLLALEQGFGQGALAVALVLLAHSLPHALLAPVSGQLADRFDRRQLMVGAQLVQALATAGMLFAALADQLLVLEGLLLLRASIGALALPARTAAVRQLVQPGELLQANALSGATWSVMFAVGMALGGLLASLGPALALGVDALSFVLAAGLYLALPSMPAPSSTQRSSGGLRALQGRPKLLAASLAKTPLALAGGAAWVVLNLQAEALAFVGTAALTLGALQFAKGLGTGIGPVLAERLGGGAVLGRAIELSGLAGMLLFVLSAQPLWLLAGSLLWGIGSGGNWVLSTAELQQRAPEGSMGRLSALDFLSSTLAQSLSALAAAALIELGLSPALSATTFVLAGFLAALALKRLRAHSRVNSATLLALQVPLEERRRAAAVKLSLVGANSSV